MSDGRRRLPVLAGFHDDGVRIHRILLEAGIWLIEGLDLSAVRAGRYEMICLRSVHESDGAPPEPSSIRSTAERPRSRPGLQEATKPVW